MCRCIICLYSNDAAGSYLLLAMSTNMFVTSVKHMLTDLPANRQEPKHFSTQCLKPTGLHPCISQNKTAVARTMGERRRQWWWSIVSLLWRSADWWRKKGCQSIRPATTNDVLDFNETSSRECLVHQKPFMWITIAWTGAYTMEWLWCCHSAV